MRPFLIDYGPSSAHVLRLGHPLIDTLYNMPVVGDSYAIIESNGRLLCMMKQGARVFQTVLSVTVLLTIC